MVTRCYHEVLVIGATGNMRLQIRVRGLLQVVSYDQKHTIGNSLRLCTVSPGFDCDGGSLCIASGTLYDISHALILHSTNLELLMVPENSTKRFQSSVLGHTRKAMCARRHLNTAQ
jgi:hypothetical protein